MPKLVNRNDHAVRARDENGRSHRLRPGQVVDADGAQADALKGVSGVESASSSDEDAYNETLAQGSSDEVGEGQTAMELYAKARLDGKILTVVLPLQEVIGDNAAPFGPPTGTITTKQAIAAEADPDSLTSKAFGDHERTADQADDEMLQPVEREQARGVAALEEAKAHVEEVHAENAERKASKTQARSQRKQAKAESKE